MPPATSFKLAVEGGGLVLEFGQQDGDAVRVADRVELTAAAAQRLLLALDAALAPHQARLLAEEAQALPPAQAARRMDPAAEPGLVAQELLELVSALGAPFHREGSFRVSAAGLATERFLLTLNLRDIPGDAAARCLAIARRLSMPEAARQAAVKGFPAATQVHFGFEGEPGAVICKLYLERSVAQAEAEAAARAGHAVPRHLAFKWNRASGASVTSHYLWHPGLAQGAIAARLQRMFAGADGRALPLALGALHLAASRLAPGQMQYLEVAEAGTQRRSFDLNFYGSGLLVRDAQPILAGMREVFGIRPGQFQALLDGIWMQPLGHIAGGLHREGQAFFNVYAGATRVTR